MTRLLLTPLLLLALQSSNPQSAIESRNSQSAIETAHLSLTVINPSGPIAPGARLSLRVKIVPKPRMHVYAPGQKDYIPISLTLANSDRFLAAAAVYPKPETLYFRPLDETQLVYSKPFQIRQDVTLARTAAVRGLAGTPHAALTISGTVRYQACDDTLCYPPRTVPVTWIVPVR